jgi:hypothetical protein
VSPVYLRPDVWSVARDIYHRRTFGELSCLADALIDSGMDPSDHPPLFAHLRAEGLGHYHGCWALERVCGRLAFQMYANRARKVVEAPEQPASESEPRAARPAVPAAPCAS